MKRYRAGLVGCGDWNLAENHLFRSPDARVRHRPVLGDGLGWVHFVCHPLATIRFFVRQAAPLGRRGLHFGSCHSQLELADGDSWRRDSA